MAWVPVDNVRSGAMSTADFETWLQFQLTAGAITAEEAGQWRRQTESRSVVHPRDSRGDGS